LNFISKIKNNKDVVKNQVYNTLNFFLTALIALLTIKIITTKIDPESYGIYRYALATVGLCAVSTLTGINKTIGGYVAKGFHGTVKETTILSFKTGSIGILILLSFGIYSLYQKNNTTESILFITAALYFFPFTIFSRYASILAGLEKFKKILIYSFIQKIILFSGAVFVVIILNKGILAYGASQLILTAIILIIFYITTIKQLTNTKTDHGYFKHSLTVSAVGIGSQIITPGIQLVLNLTMGSTALALYVIGNRIPTQLAGIVKPLMHPISIRLAKKGKIEYNTAAIKLIPLTLVLGLLLYLIFYLGIHYIGPYVIGESYSDALHYAKLLGLFILLSPTYSLLNSNVIFEKNNRAYAFSLYTNQALTIGGYIIFLGKYGIPAIAITNMVALSVQIMVMVFFITKNINNNVS